MTTIFKAAAKLLTQADSLIITAGAGMGVDSGLPDFRGDCGFWQAYPALGHNKLSFTDVACPQTFKDDPNLAWGFYGHRLNLYRETIPHEGFQFLLHWAEQLKHGAFVYTSNVDGQFQKSGFDSFHIIECHGSIHHLQTLSGSNKTITHADEFLPIVDTEHVRLLSALPKDAITNELLRPNILMFGDCEWQDHRTEEQLKCFRSWLNLVKRPLIIELGAGTTLATIRRTSERLASSLTNAHLIRINPTDFQVLNQNRDISIKMGALNGLRSIAGEV